MHGSPLADLLCNVELPDKLHKLSAVPKLIERELGGDRMDVSAPIRWATRGKAGVRLQTLRMGRARFTTLRWLVEFFLATDDARRQADTAKSESRNARRERQASAETELTEDERAVLERHGLGEVE